MKKVFTLPLVVSALILAACASEADVAASGTEVGQVSAPTPTPTPTPTPSPTVETASAAEYGEIMLENRKRVNDFLETWEEDDCHPLKVAAGDIWCNLNLVSASPIGSIIDLQFKNAYTPTSKAYIGPPPTELENVVADTASIGKRLKEAADNAMDECPEGDECDLMVDDVEDALADLQLKFEVWELYL